MKPIHILGYATPKAIREAGFTIPAAHKDEYIALFLGYSDDDKEIKVGKKIKGILRDDNELYLTDLEMKEISLGFAGLSNHIPKGYKSLVLFSDEKKTIKELRKVLPKLSTWEITDKKFLAFDDHKKVKFIHGKEPLAKARRAVFISYTATYELTPSSLAVRLMAKRLIGKGKTATHAIFYEGKYQDITPTNEEKIKEEIEKHLKESD